MFSESPTCPICMENFKDITDRQLTSCMVCSIVICRNVCGKKLREQGRDFPCPQCRGVGCFDDGSGGLRRNVALERTYHGTQELRDAGNVGLPPKAALEEDSCLVANARQMQESPVRPREVQHDDIVSIGSGGGGYLNARVLEIERRNSNIRDTQGRGGYVKARVLEIERRNSNIRDAQDRGASDQPTVGAVTGGGRGLAGGRGGSHDTGGRGVGSRSFRGSPNGGGRGPGGGTGGGPAAVARGTGGGPAAAGTHRIKPISNESFFGRKVVKLLQKQSPIPIYKFARKYEEFWNEPLSFEATGLECLLARLQLGQCCFVKRRGEAKLVYKHYAS